MYIALDLETYLMKSGKHPKPICVSWYGDFASLPGVSEDVEGVMRKYLSGDYKLIFHNAKFDLGCIYWHFKELRPLLFKALEEGRIHDTLIREKLYNLSTKGRIKGPKYNLAHLTLKYLGIDITSSKKGDDVARLWYSLLDGIPVSTWGDINVTLPNGTVIPGQEFYDYALSDTEYTYKVFFAQEDIRQESGVGSMNTEQLQVRADFCLDVWGSHGMNVDYEYALNLNDKLDAALEPLKDRLVELGFARREFKNVSHMESLIEKYHANIESLQKRLEKGKLDPVKAVERIEKERTKIKKTEERLIKGRKINAAGGLYFKENKIFQEYLEKEYPNFVKYTGKKAVRVDDEALSDFPQDEVIQIRKQMSILERYKSTYIPKLLRQGKVHFNYDILKETGRTSSFVQIIPKEGGMREVFVPSEGKAIMAIDYSAIELCAVAQCMTDLFGQTKIAHYINQGSEPTDIHAIVGAALAKRDYDSFYRDLKRGCKEAKEYRQRGKPIGLGYFGGLGCETMVKVARSQGVEMTLEQAEEARRLHAELFPEIIKYIGYRSSRDGIEHQYEAGWISDQAVEFDSNGNPLKFAYSVNGRYRHNCTLCSCLNGRSMQSIAADGAKEAIFEVTKDCIMDPALEGCQPLAFIHDEILFEIPDDENKHVYAEKIAQLMIKGMKRVIPDVRVTCEASIMPRWTKNEDDFVFSKKYWSSK